MLHPRLTFVKCRYSYMIIVKIMLKQVSNLISDSNKEDYVDSLDSEVATNYNSWRIGGKS